MKAINSTDTLFMEIFNENNCLCAFDITFDKKDKTFLTTKTKNSLYYVNNNVLIDINLSKMYATDNFVCKSRNAKISNLLVIGISIYVYLLTFSKR